MRAIKLAGLAVAAILPIAAMACGGSSNNSTPTTAASSGTTPGSAATTAPGKTPAATNTPASSGNPLAALQNAGNSFKSGNFTVSYQMTETTSAGKVTNGTMAIAIKGGKSSFKLNGTLFGAQGDLVIIDDGTNSFLCTAQQKQCLKSKSGTGGAAGAFLTAFTPDKIIQEITSSGGTIKQVGDQTIAGRSAKCYQGSGASGQGTICIDKKDNVMLSAEGTNSDGSKTKLVATQIGGSPSDSDFTPPYPVQSIPGQ